MAHPWTALPLQTVRRVNAADIGTARPCIPLQAGHIGPAAFVHTRPTHSAPNGTYLGERLAGRHRPLVVARHRPLVEVAAAGPPQLLPNQPRDRLTPRANHHCDNSHDENTSTSPLMAPLTLP